MTIQTFADTLVPRAMQDLGIGGPGGFMGGAGALAIGGQGNFVPGNQQIGRPIQQVQHFKLWNYIAISRNAWAACKARPNISVIRRGSKPGAPKQAQWINKVQRQFLRENYSGVLNGNQDDLEPLADDHPLVTLLDQPNSADWWNSFAYETYMFWGLTGGFYWWVIPNGLGLPAELYVIPTQWVTPVYTKSGMLQYYRVTGNGRQIDLPPEQVIEALSKNPTDKTRPLSPLTAGAEWVINGERIEHARQQSLAQGPYPSVVMTFDPDLYATAPDEELLTRVGEKFISRYGGAPNAGKPVTLPPGIGVEPWSLKPAEMDFPNSGADVRDNVLALHGTPRAIAGLSHDLNRASINGAHLIHCETVIMPLHCWVAGVITHKLAKNRFDEKLVCWFDDVRPRDDEQELAETTLDWQMGAITSDERRQDRGRDPLGTPAASKTFIAVGLTPLEDFNEDTQQRAEATAELTNPEPAKPDSGSGKGSSDGPAVADDTSGSDGSGDAKQSLGCPVHGYIGGSTVEFSAKTYGRMAGIARGFVSLHQSYEHAAAANVKRMWSAVKKVALAHFDKGATDSSVPHAQELVSKGDFRPAFNRAMTPVWQAAATAGVKFEKQSIGAKKQAKEVELPAAIQRGIAQFLKSRQDSVWSQVLETTQEQLSASLDEGVKDGESPAKLRRRVQEVLDNRSSEAETIARTETTAALSYGQQVYRESEGIGRKVWIDTLDRKTRSSHVTAGGQVVANNQPFEVGGYKMMHPGDGSMGASADEIVNCRCCATGYVE